MAFFNTFNASGRFREVARQARSQKLLLGGSFGQNVDLFGKIVDVFYNSVDLLNEIENIFSKTMAF